MLRMIVMILTAAAIAAVGPLTAAHAAPPPTVEGTQLVRMDQQDVYFVAGGSYLPSMKQVRILLEAAAEENTDWVLSRCDYRIRGYINEGETCLGTWEMATSNLIAAAEEAKHRQQDEIYCLKIEAENGVVPQDRFNSCLRRIFYRRAEAKVHGWPVVIDYDLFMKATPAADEEQDLQQVFYKICRHGVSKQDATKAVDEFIDCLDKMLKLRSEAKNRPPVTGWSL